MSAKIWRLKLLIILFVLVPVFLIWFEGTSPAQDEFLIENQSANGTSQLLNLGARPLSVPVQAVAANESAATERTTLAILGPRIPFSDTETAAIKQIITLGGTVLLADNFGTGNTLLESLKVPIRFGNATILDDLFYVRAPDFPLVYDISPTLSALGVRELALNKAVPLMIDNAQSVTELAKTSPYSYVDLNSNGDRDEGEPNGPFPVLASIAIGQGTLFILPSPGSLANGMLHAADNHKFVEFLSANESRSIYVDQMHLALSPSAGIKVKIRQFFEAVGKGTLDHTSRVAIATLTTLVMIAWTATPKIQEWLGRTSMPSPEREPKTIEEVLRLHPTWTKERLEYLEREMRLSKPRRSA